MEPAVIFSCSMHILQSVLVSAEIEFWNENTLVWMLASYLPGSREHEWSAISV